MIRNIESRVQPAQNLTKLVTQTLRSETNLDPALEPYRQARHLYQLPHLEVTSPENEAGPVTNPLGILAQTVSNHSENAQVLQDMGIGNDVSAVGARILQAQKNSEAAHYGHVRKKLKEREAQREEARQAGGPEVELSEQEIRDVAFVASYEQRRKPKKNTTNPLNSGRKSRKGTDFKVPVEKNEALVPRTGTPSHPIGHIHLSHASSLAMPYITPRDAVPHQMERSGWSKAGKVRDVQNEKRNAHTLVTLYNATAQDNYKALKKFPSPYYRAFQRSLLANIPPPTSMPNLFISLTPVEEIEKREAQMHEEESERQRRSNRWAAALFIPAVLSAALAADSRVSATFADIQSLLNGSSTPDLGLQAQTTVQETATPMISPTVTANTRIAMAFPTRTPERIVTPRVVAIDTPKAIQTPKVTLEPTATPTVTPTVRPIDVATVVAYENPTVTPTIVTIETPKAMPTQTPAPIEGSINLGPPAHDDHPNQPRSVAGNSAGKVTEHVNASSEDVPKPITQVVTLGGNENLWKYSDEQIKQLFPEVGQRRETLMVDVNAAIAALETKESPESGVEALTLEAAKQVGQYVKDHPEDPSAQEITRTDIIHPTEKGMKKYYAAARDLRDRVLQAGRDTRSKVVNIVSQATNRLRSFFQ